MSKILSAYRRRPAAVSRDDGAADAEKLVEAVQRGDMRVKVQRELWDDE